jgi:hypothetical protein
VLLRKRHPRAALTLAPPGLVYRGLVDEPLADLKGLGVGRVGVIGAARRWECALAPLLAAEPDVAVELKHARGSLPRWLDALGCARGVAHGKFGAACGHAARWAGA